MPLQNFLYRTRIGIAVLKLLRGQFVKMFQEFLRKSRVIILYKQNVQTRRNVQLDVVMTKNRGFVQRVQQDILANLTEEFGKMKKTVWSPSVKKGAVF